MSKELEQLFVGQLKENQKKEDMRMATCVPRILKKYKPCYHF